MQMEPRNAKPERQLKRGKGVGEEESFRAPFIAVTKLKISIQF